MINEVVLIGNLTRDIELKYFNQQDGSQFAVGSSHIAIYKQFNKNGVKQSETSFFELKMLGRTAEIVAQYFNKGSKIAIKGELKQERWINNQTGKEQSKVVIIVNGFEFMTANKNEGANSAQSYQAAQQGYQAAPQQQNHQPQNYTQPQPQYQAADDGIPF